MAETSVWAANVVYSPSAPTTCDKSGHCSWGDSVGNSRSRNHGLVRHHQRSGFASARVPMTDVDERGARWLWPRALAYMFLFGGSWFIALPIALLHAEGPAEVALRSPLWICVGGALFVAGSTLSVIAGYYLGFYWHSVALGLASHAAPRTTRGSHPKPSDSNAVGPRSS